MCYNQRVNFYTTHGDLKMDTICLEIVAAISAIAFGVGFKVGTSKTKTVSYLDVPCKVLIKEVSRLSKKHNISMTPNKVKTEAINGKVSRVSCQYFNPKTKDCDINNKLCRLYN